MKEEKTLRQIEREIETAETALLVVNDMIKKGFPPKYNKHVKYMKEQAECTLNELKLLKLIKKCEKCSADQIEQILNDLINENRPNLSGIITMLQELLEIARKREEGTKN